MTDRIPCCVPFCGRTIGADRLPLDHVWICQPHWKGVPSRLKTRRRLAKRIADRAVQQLRRLTILQDGHTPEQYRRVVVAKALHAKTWQRCMDAAVAAGGMM